MARRQAGGDRLNRCGPRGLAAARRSDHAMANPGAGVVKIHVREAAETDQQAISDCVVAAFGDAQGPEIARLIDDLSADPTAKPRLSLVATVDDRVVGHVLFTKARIRHSQRVVSSEILAPLSVHRDYQNEGIGGRLVGEGLERLRASGVELVFVLGHPGYYPKFGFSPAGSEGFDAPYPIPPENAGAWMVQELRPGVIGSVKGQVECADALMDPRHWQE